MYDPCYNPPNPDSCQFSDYKYVVYRAPDGAEYFIQRNNVFDRAAAIVAVTVSDAVQTVLADGLLSSPAFLRGVTTGIAAAHYVKNIKIFSSVIG